MTIHQLIGKTITALYSDLEMEIGGLDKGQIFLELNHSQIIEIPYSPTDQNLEQKPSEKAQNLLHSLADYPVYSLKPKSESTSKPTLFSKIKNRFRGSSKTLGQYQLSGVEFHKNQLKNTIAK